MNSKFIQFFGHSLHEVTPATQLFPAILGKADPHLIAFCNFPALLQVQLSESEAGRTVIPPKSLHLQTLRLRRLVPPLLRPGLRPGSASAQVCSSLLKSAQVCSLTQRGAIKTQDPSHQKSSTFHERPEKTSPQPGIPNMFNHTDRYENVNPGG
jgi:hypothetical protein